MTVDLCKTIYSDPGDNGNHIQMGFLYSGLIGGKRKNNKTIKSRKNKTIKSRKNKTIKSRKNKTIKK